MAFVPFTVYLEFKPMRGMQRNPDRQPAAASSGVTRGRKGGRFDYVRDMQRIAAQVYDELADAPGITLAEPGGSQNALHGRLSNINFGTGVAQQFGNSPNRLMIEGFAEIADLSASLQPAPETKVFHGNEVLEGFRGEQPWLGPAGNPTTATEDEVSLIKKTVENAVAGVVDADAMAPRVFRIDYKGTIWGDRGHHFPQSSL